MSMSPVDWMNLVFFLSFTVFAWTRPFGARRRRRAAGLGVAGIGMVLAGRFARHVLPDSAGMVVHDWLPVPLMLLAYWQAGQLFREPNQALQVWLERFDQRVYESLPQLHAGERARAWTAVYFEVAYLLCYPLVPLAIGILYSAGMSHRVQEFWTAVLPPTYLCYAMVPFIQTLPPRRLPQQRDQRAPSGIRALNVWILGHASIRVNTFPSAHVAASTAAALVLLSFLPPAGMIFLWMAVSIAIGSVAGRYHYAADAFTGAGVAAAAFLLLGPGF
ncbi:MAG: phosphatase PAP2 family protein [Acidobacteria bacterium]|nr:phosphatase PAP2 family protein [Acidobacteriota bacterium]